MDTELLKLLSQGGALVLSIAANLGLIKWITHLIKKTDTIQEARLTEAREYAQAMSDARVAQVKHSAETARTVDNLSKVLSSFGGNAPSGGN